MFSFNNFYIYIYIYFLSKEKKNIICEQDFVTDDAPFDLVDNGTCSPVNSRLVPERPRENVTLKKHVTN